MTGVDGQGPSYGVSRLPAMLSLPGTAHDTRHGLTRPEDTQSRQESRRLDPPETGSDKVNNLRHGQPAA